MLSNASPYVPTSRLDSMGVGVYVATLRTSRRNLAGVLGVPDTETQDWPGVFRVRMTAWSLKERLGAAVFTLRQLERSDVPKTYQWDLYVQRGRRGDIAAALVFLDWLLEHVKGPFEVRVALEAKRIVDGR